MLCCECRSYIKIRGNKILIELKLKYRWSLNLYCVYCCTEWDSWFRHFRSYVQETCFKLEPGLRHTHSAYVRSLWRTWSSWVKWVLVWIAQINREDARKSDLTVGVWMGSTFYYITSSLSLKFGYMHCMVPFSFSLCSVNGELELLWHLSIDSVVNNVYS